MRQTARRAGATTNRSGSATTLRMMRLPSGTRRAAGGEPESERSGRDRPADIGAKHERQRQAAPAPHGRAASDITSSTIDRLECTSQVTAVATRKPRIGSPARPAEHRAEGDGFLQRRAPRR